MIQEFIICALVLSSTVALAALPEPVSEGPTEEIQHATLPYDVNATSAQIATSPVTIYRNRFESYEKRIRMFLENMRREYFSLNTDSARFLKELDSYLVQLPMYNTKMVSKKVRSTCYCDGMMATPCPDKCINSCYLSCDYYGSLALGCNNHVTNCSGTSYKNCKCYQGSSQDCNYGSISNCYEQKLVEVPSDNQTCVNATINHAKIRESFVRFSDLLIEPLKILVRGLEFKLDTFKQSLVAADLISNASSHFCDDNDTKCTTEPSELLSKNIKNLWQLKGNITLHMIKTHRKAETVAKDVDDFKEQIVHQVNEAIKNYTCCLKGLDFTEKGNDCDPKPIELSTMTVSIRNSRIQAQAVQVVNARKTCTYPNFECDNLKCISDSYRCDGTDDCDDNSDEEDC